MHNYHEDKGVRSFPGHDGSITRLAVHPTHPFVLSSSDYDYLIKLWDWEKDWECTRTFQGHTNRVTQITFNPDYPSSFASASADGSAMVSSFSVSPYLNFTSNYIWPIDSERVSN